jgi:hypothetical protein
VQVTWKLLYELRLSFTSSLVSNTDQLLEAEYKLDRVVSVHAEAGRSTQIQIGDLGLDLKLKWEF